MHAEIISIGSELTTGAKLDTNSQWLSLELAALGIPVWYHTTVADEQEANVRVLRAAVDRADLVLVTGGLGPTLDDLTREVLARLAGVELVLHEPSLEIIRGMFSRRGRPMPERNVVQAMFPAGATPLANPRGTAPGIFLEIARVGRTACRVFAMPGVPSEMKVMFHGEVAPRIALDQPCAPVIRHARINCFGLGESAFEELLGDVTARGRDPEVGITVHEATITLRIVAVAATAAECEQKIAATARVIHDRLGDYVFGVEDEQLQDVVVRRLAALGRSVSAAEDASSGLLSQSLAVAAGPGGGFRGGFVGPVAMLAQELTAGDAAAGGGEVAPALAAGCRNRLNADFGLAVSACLPAAPGDPAAEFPRVTIALACKDRVEMRELNLAGDPAILRSRVVKSALNLLRLELLRSSSGCDLPPDVPGLGDQEHEA